MSNHLKSLTHEDVIIKGKTDNYRVCPYDPSHLKSADKITNHILKCRRNLEISQNQQIELIPCPINRTHTIYKTEVKYHLNYGCKDNSIVYNNILTQHNGIAYEPPPVNSCNLDIQSSENWDDLEDVPTYNPEQYVLDKPILRCKKGSHAVKKKFKQNEILRFKKLNEMNEFESSNVPSTSSSAAKPQQNSELKWFNLNTDQEDSISKIQNQMDNLNFKENANSTLPTGEKFQNFWANEIEDFVENKQQFENACSNISQKQNYYGNDDEDDDIRSESELSMPPILRKAYTLDTNTHFYDSDRSEENSDISMASSIGRGIRVNRKKKF